MHKHLLVAIFLAVTLDVSAQIPAGPLVWLRADTGIVATAGRVRIWRDVSGRFNDARQDVAAEQPTLLPAAANGRPVVHFNGANHLVGGAVFPVGADYSLTFVVRIDNFGATNNIVSGNSHAHWLGGDRYPKVLHGDFSTQATSSVPLSTGFNVVTMSYRQNGTRAAIHVNGLFADSAIVGANSDPTIFLGAFQKANYLAGDLAEVILYGRELAAVERRQVESYLTSRWGVTVPRPYSPPAAGPLLWLKADSGVVVANGRVARWEDRSGNGYAARQDTIALQPTLIANATFDLPAVRFSGSGDFLEATPVFPVGSDYSLLFVVRLNNIGATNNVVSGNSHAHWFGGNAYAKVLHGNFATQSTASILVVPSEFAIITMSYLEARQRAIIHIDGLLADSAMVGTNSDPTLYLGAFQKSSVLNGDLAEVLLYNRELSETDRKRSEDYLARKYGITLPPPPLPPDTTFTAIPAQLQFLARNAADSATLEIAGTVRVAGFDSIHVVIMKNDQPWKRMAQQLRYSDGGAPFRFRPSIHAELSEYDLVVGLTSSTRDSTIATRDSIVCGDAILITGQSNSIFGNGSPATREFARTFGNNFSPSPRDTFWTLARSSGYGGGPDIGAWGMRLAGMLIDSIGVPVCVINGGVGGTTIEQHRRNDADPADRSTIYGSMLYRARKSGLAGSARALLWYQGESNTLAGYYENFHALHDDWRSDYPALEKLYVVQIRPGCSAGEQRDLRELLRTLGDSLPDIVTYSPMGVTGHDGCHYSAAGYDTIGAQIFRLVARDLYGATDTVDIGSPDIRKAFFTDESLTTIALVFDNARGGLALTPDTVIGGVPARIAESFIVDDGFLVESVSASSDTIYLRLSTPRPASTVGYIPRTTYRDTNVIFEGPWVRNRRGLGAFAFDRFPITAADPASGVDDERSIERVTIAAVPNPAMKSTALIFTLPRAGSARITLHDATGRLVMERTIQADAGRNMLRIDTGVLVPGVYHCMMSSADGARSIRLVVVR